MKKLILPIIGSVLGFNTMFFALTGNLFNSVIAGGMLYVGLLILLMIWEEIKASK